MNRMVYLQKLHPAH
jgi:ubiquinol-cytochrome c reductase cytochrome c1 subunit